MEKNNCATAIEKRPRFRSRKEAAAPLEGYDGGAIGLDGRGKAIYAVEEDDAKSK